MTNLSINTFTGTIQNHSVQLINARDLHKVLEVQTPFRKWIERRLSNDFLKKDIDFIERTTLSNRGFFKTEIKEYHLTLDTAKHLCLMENNDIGYQLRQQFIENDNQARALIPQLHAQNKQLHAQLQQIPTFLRHNPDFTAKLIQTAQNAYLQTEPTAKALIRYREMGLTRAEMAKLLNLTGGQIEWRIRNLLKLGLIQAKAHNQHTAPQLALF